MYYFGLNLSSLEAWLQLVFKQEDFTRFFQQVVQSESKLFNTSDWEINSDDTVDLDYNCISQFIDYYQNELPEGFVYHDYIIYYQGQLRHKTLPLVFCLVAHDSLEFLISIRGDIELLTMQDILDEFQKWINMGRLEPDTQLSQMKIY